MNGIRLALSIMLTVLFILHIGKDRFVSADEEDMDELDDLESDELLFAILGHANKKKPNKANIR